MSSLFLLTPFLLLGPRGTFPAEAPQGQELHRPMCYVVSIQHGIIAEGVWLDKRLLCSLLAPLAFSLALLLAPSLALGLGLLLRRLQGTRASVMAASLRSNVSCTRTVNHALNNDFKTRVAAHYPCIRFHIQDATVTDHQHARGLGLSGCCLLGGLRITHTPTPDVGTSRGRAGRLTMGCHLVLGLYQFTGHHGCKGVRANHVNPNESNRCVETYIPGKTGHTGTQH